MTLQGRFDYDHQIVYAGRSRQGSPGVYLLTPVRSNSGDTLVLVNRGWVYSPDAASVDESRWREGDSARVTGYVETFVTSTLAPSAANPRRLHALDFATVQRIVGAPIAPYLVVRTDTAATPAPGAVDSVPARLEIPPLDEGPHQSYAIQWFAFATIAAVGGVVLVRMTGRRTEG